MSGNRQQEQVRVDVAKIIKPTLKAWMVELPDGQKVFVPKSQTHSVCEDPRDLHLMVTPFIAKSMGLY